MLEVKTGRHNGVYVKAEGPAEEIVADIGMMISKIHMGVKQRDPQLATAFRAAVMAITMPTSPIWEMEQTSDEVMAVQINRKK